MGVRDLTVLVTGASEGIGRALAFEFGTSGVGNLIVTARNGAALDFLASEIHAAQIEEQTEIAEEFAAEIGEPLQPKLYTTPVTKVVGDITNPHWQHEIVEACLATGKPDPATGKVSIPKLDIAVHNAGTWTFSQRLKEKDLATEASRRSFIYGAQKGNREVTELNFKTVLDLTDALYGLHMRAERPMVVYVGSQAGQVHLPGNLHYGAGKAALNFARAQLFYESEGRIESGLIVPGQILTRANDRPGIDYATPQELAEFVVPHLLCAGKRHTDFFVGRVDRRTVTESYRFPFEDERSLLPELNIGEHTLAHKIGAATQSRFYGSMHASLKDNKDDKFVR